jgi:hypothetical protein
MSFGSTSICQSLLDWRNKHSQPQKFRCARHIGDAVRDQSTGAHSGARQRLITLREQFDDHFLQCFVRCEKSRPSADLTLIRLFDASAFPIIRTSTSPGLAQ